MIIKQALLKSEIRKIKEFLSHFDLVLDKDVTETFYMEEDAKIIATISRSDYIIKCLAIAPEYQGENIASSLITKVILSLASEKKHYYQVFTKTEYKPLFESMNFTTISSTDKVAILEGGNSSINEEIENIKRKIELKIGANLEDLSIGAIVVNCNPITLGHYQLIEYASQKHDYFLVFVLEEDLSFFSFQERYSLIYLALTSLENVVVIPSTRYIVSSLTFPSYFLKTMEERDEEHAKLDAIIFRDYFMPKLNIKTRYLGTEKPLVMVKYNQILKDTLKERVEIIPRFKHNNQVISASLVRRLIIDNRIEDALQYVPKATHTLLSEIAKKKYEEYHK